ncbi:MAG: hypothetical protein QM756_35400 [Polyangiaceae bacterium]
MRDSFVHIRRSAPDTTELDAGWDFDGTEPASPNDTIDPLDSLRPSHTSLRLLESVPPRTRTPRLLPAAALIVAAAAAAGAVTTFTREHRTAPLSATTPTAAPVAQPPAAAPAPAPAPAPVVEAAPPLLDPPLDVAAPTDPRRVMLEIDPPGATVFIRGQRVGNDLVNVELGPDHHERATITLPGYTTRSIDLDGSESFVHVVLKRRPAPRAQPRPPATDPAVPATEAAGVAAQVDGDAPKPVESAPPSESSVAYPE